MIKTSSAFLRSSICLFFIIASCTFSFMNAGKYTIIPYPQQLIPAEGSFKINNRTAILCDFKQPAVLKLAQQFSNQMEIVSGMKLPVKNIENADSVNMIIFQTITETNPEAYNLIVSPKTIRIQAQAANGFFYGIQTLYQLLPAEVYGKSKKQANWSASCVNISDAPRFAYRGLHLDVCRHFFPVEFIKKYIDAMAIHKFNTFHWHLTDDQGWRIEIKKYPKLTEIGSKRDETIIGYYFERFPQQFDGKPYGGFYTQDEAREIVAYAAERFITVIPEIEMPGHAQAALAAYPYLSCNNDSTIKVATKWGIFKDVFCPGDTTFSFLQDVLTEIMAIFPSKYIHIGGDECPKDRWKESAECQALIQKENLKDENGLQSYFIHRIENFLNAHGRRIIGWDEILDGGLAPNATVMSWRGTKGGIVAAKAGNDVIMTPGNYCYFDKFQASPETEPMTIGGYLPVSMVYQYEPVPTELTNNEAKHILGAQANVWTEYMPDSRRVEYMVYPRLAAMSEVLWTSKTNRNWNIFRNNMKTQFQRYKELDINCSRAFYEVQFQSSLTADNKVQVALNCDDPDAEIHFSINGKNQVYNQPIVLQESTEISATAYEHGKAVGKTISKSYVVSMLTGLSYTKNFENTWYNGGNVNALTDGVPGNAKAYTQWVAFRKGGDAEIRIDMKKAQSIQRFSVGILNAPALCCIISPEIKLFGSLNGTDYTLLAQKEMPKGTLPTWEIFRPELIFPSTEVRYLKLVLQNAGNCEADPAGVTNGSVLFVDEISAW